MFNIGGGELLVILVVALLVLGPDKLPEAARQIGKFMGELRKYSTGFQNELKNALDEPVETAARERGAKLKGSAAAKRLTGTGTGAHKSGASDNGGASTNGASAPAGSNASADDAAPADDAASVDSHGVDSEVSATSASAGAEAELAAAGDGEPVDPDAVTDERPTR